MARTRLGFQGSGMAAAVGALHLLGFAPPARAVGPVVPVGSEFQVNSYTTSFQDDPDVAVAADGDFVAVWTGYGSSGSDTSGSSIQGRRFGSAGNALGSDFQINTYTTDYQVDSSLAMEPDGDFVVVWQIGIFGPGGGIRGQRFDSAGSAVGNEFQISSAGDAPSVAVDGDGDFLVVWPGASITDTDSIKGQRYDGAGTALGSEFQVNTYTTGSQFDTSAAMDGDGDSVVVWASGGSSGSDTSGFSIQGQRYDSAGNAVGSQFQVNSYTTSYQLSPSVAMNAGGDFVIVWHSEGSYGGDTSGRSIQGQRYDSAGSELGNEFQVNTYTTDHQVEPSVEVEADGDFLVVWQSQGSVGSDASGDSIQAQRYASAGNAVGSQFQVNTYTTGSQRGPSVAATDGKVVVVWDSDGSLGTDTSGSSIQGQRYAEAPKVPSLSAAGFAAGALLMLASLGYALRRHA